MRRLVLVSAAVVFAFSLACGGNTTFSTTSDTSSSGSSSSSSAASSASSSGSATATVGTGLTSGPWKSMGVPVSDASQVTATDSALAITYPSGTITSRSDAFIKPLTDAGWSKTSDINSPGAGRVVNLSKGGATMTVAATTQGSNVVIAVSLTGSP